MADFTNTGALATLESVLAQTPTTYPTTLWVQLHTGDPGADGDQNVAQNDERKQITFDQAATSGSDGAATATSNNNVSWPSVPATETYSWISIWDDETVGAAWYKDQMISPVSVTAGGAFVFPIGQTITHT